MNPTTVKVNGNEYRFKYEQPREDAGLWFAVVEFLVLDEMTHQPVRAPITLTSERAGIHQRAGRPTGGVTGLVGVLEHVFRGIDLSLAAQPITVTCNCNGYLPASVRVNIGPIVGYPDQIGNALPVQGGSLLLHHQPVTIEGRITSSNGAVAGATVELNEFMLGVVTPDTTFNADTRIPAALPVPCYANRDIDDECYLVNLGNGVASDKTLIAAVNSNQRLIQLSDASDLAVGDLIEIDSAGMSEVIEIARISEVADVGHINHSNSYAEVELVHATGFRHPMGVLVRHRTAIDNGPPKLIKLPCIRGDACLLLDDVAGWSANDVIRIHSVAGADEYHRIDFYRTTSDVDGYYRLPAMNRLGQLSIGASQGAMTGEALRIIPDYTRHRYLIDIGVALP